MPKFSKSFLAKFAKKKPVVAVVKPIKRRRYRKRLSPNLKKLAFQIDKINQERNDSGWVASTETVVGQVIGSGANAIQSGHYASSITPIPSQGDSQVQRTGDSITLTGIYSMFQFAQQSNALQATRGKIIFATPKFSSQNSVVSGASTYGIETLLNPNPIILAQSSVNVYDYICTRNQDYIKDWTILRTVNFRVGSDTVSGMKGVKTVRAGLRFKTGHKVHFAPGTNTIVSGDIRVFILFENGNGGAVLTNGTPNSGLTTNAIGVPVKDTLSGWTMCYMSKSYYLA